jgi:hypothetical protein
MLHLLFLIFCSLFWSSIQYPSIHDTNCNIPDAKASYFSHPSPNLNRFIVFGGGHVVGSGLGNVMNFFPALYYYALTTGLDASDSIVE